MSTASTPARAAVPSPPRLLERQITVLPPLSKSDQTTLHTWDECLKRAVMLHRAVTAAISYYGWRIKKSGRWAEFGCTGEIDYRMRRQISESMWKECMRIGRVLESLPFEELSVIPQRNARSLTYVSPAIWHDYPWLKESKTTPVREFEKLVRQRNRLLLGTGHADPVADTRQRVMAKLQSVRDQHDLKSMSDALEFLLTKVPDDTSVELLSASRRTKELLGIAIDSMTRVMDGKVKVRERMLVLANSIKLLEKARKRIGEAIALSAKAIEEVIERKEREQDTDAIHTVKAD